MTAVALEQASYGSISPEERLLIGALGDITAQRHDQALQTLETLLAQHPNFRLAQMLYGDMLLAKVSEIKPFENPPSTHLSAAAALKDEALTRFNHHRDIPLADQIPEQLLALPRSVVQAIVVDVSASRFYVFKNEPGGLRLTRDYYVSTGKKGANKIKEGDQKTPVGVYFITGAIPSSDLPEFYGAGALPVNYPNEWDIRNGHTGYGIWIHGVPENTYARAPRASDGCIVLANEDLSALWEGLVRGGTPVIVTDRATWVSRNAVNRRRVEILRQIEAWRIAWESLDLARYAAFYSEEFRTKSKTYLDWIAYKSEVNTVKSYIDVELTKLSVVGYPGEDNLVVVTFFQDYRSNNYSSQTNKRQYWKREADGVWRIVYEGPVEILPEHVRGIPYSARSNLTSIDP